jgi:hypothetical protein
MDIRYKCILRLDNNFRKSDNNFSLCQEHTKCSPHILYDGISCLSLENLLIIYKILNNN